MTIADMMVAPIAATERPTLVGNRLALAGVAMYFLEWVGIIAFNFGNVPASQGTKAAEILAQYVQHGPGIELLAGWLSLVLLGRILFVAGIRHALRRSGADTLLADFAVLAMAVSVILEVAAYAIASGGAYAAAGGADQSTIVGIDGVANFVNLVLAAPIGVSVLAASLAMVRSRLFPAWLSWLGRRRRPRHLRLRRDRRPGVRGRWDLRGRPVRDRVGPPGTCPGSLRDPAGRLGLDDRHRRRPVQGCWSSAHDDARLTRRRDDPGAPGAGHGARRRRPLRARHRGDGRNVNANGAATLVLGASFPVVGWLIASRRPDNRIGWMFLAAGVVFALGPLSSSLRRVRSGRRAGILAACGRGGVAVDPVLGSRVHADDPPAPLLSRWPSSVSTMAADPLDRGRFRRPHAGPQCDRLVAIPRTSVDGWIGWIGGRPGIGHCRSAAGCGAVAKRGRRGSWRRRAHHPVPALGGDGAPADQGVRDRGHRRDRPVHPDGAGAIRIPAPADALVAMSSHR